MVRETPGEPETKFTIHVRPRQVRDLVLAAGDGRELVLPWDAGKPLRLAPGRYTLKDVRSNGPSGMVQLFAGRFPVRQGQSFTVADKDQIVIRQATTFAEIGAMPVAGTTAVSLAELGSSGGGGGF